MMPTACLALAVGYVCLADPQAHTGHVGQRAVLLTCAEPHDRAAALRVPDCDAVDEPGEEP